MSKEKMQNPVILLIDDDPDFTEMNRLLLESNGYTVVCAHDPVEGWKKMSEENPSLVITDLMMQNLDSGFSFSKQIKDDQRFKNVPVIILTSVSTQRGYNFHPQTAEELVAMNADAFFEKPVSAKVLLEKIRELLKTAS